MNEFLPIFGKNKLGDKSLQERCQKFRDSKEKLILERSLSLMKKRVFAF